MKKYYTKYILVLSLFVFLPLTVFAKLPESISVFPEHIIQGEPIRISIESVASLREIKNIKFNGKTLGVFMYKNYPTAIYGADLNIKPGEYRITAELSGGTILEKIITIEKREKIEAPLGIPEKLGGNTPQSQTRLVNTLAEENKSLLGLRTGTKAFWTEKFRFPVSNPIVTDEYGYSRKTGEYSIAHKGADFRAKEGTKVLAMNRGVVRLTREYRNYGKTVIVDHGLGLQTFYMHLSKINVNVGELVKPGQVIGLSGQTGYASEPHLHLTVRIDDISIDPIKFLELFK